MKKLHDFAHLYSKSMFLAWPLLLHSAIYGYLISVQVLWKPKYQSKGRGPMDVVRPSRARPYARKAMPARKRTNARLALHQRAQTPRHHTTPRPAANSSADTPRPATPALRQIKACIHGSDFKWWSWSSFYNIKSRINCQNCRFKGSKLLTCFILTD